MHATHRLFSIVQMLRAARKPLLAKWLAEQLEVSVRTIYRDIAELQAQYIPIEGETGVGYVLRKTVDLPPLMLTPDELDVVLLGSHWVSTRGDQRLSLASKSLVSKINNVVPEHMQSTVIQNSVVSGPALSEVVPDEIDTGPLRQAIKEGKKVVITYTDKKGQQSERIIWPFIIAYFETTRVIAAWCELRESFRHFRTDRISAIDVTEDCYSQSPERLKKEWYDSGLATVSSA